MTTLVYVAFAAGDDALGYTARVPDLPGVEASGSTLADLLAQTREAVIARLKALEGDGDEWPRPSTLSAVAPQAGASPFLVDVHVEDTPVRINISIGEQLLKRLDAAADARGATRSGFIAQAVRHSLGERAGLNADFEAAAKKLQDELSAVGRKISDSLGPESAFSRSMSQWDERVTDTVRKAADNVSAAMARRRGQPGAQTESRSGSDSGSETGFTSPTKDDKPGRGPADEAAQI